MLQLSEIMLIFAPSFRKEWRHRGEQLSFDPPVNLENSMCTGEKTEKLFLLQLHLYCLLLCVESALINTCRCELISFLRTQVLQNLQAIEWQVGSHSCVYVKLYYGKKTIV